MPLMVVHDCYIDYGSGLVQRRAGLAARKVRTLIPGRPPRVWRSSFATRGCVRASDRVPQTRVCLQSPSNRSTLTRFFCSLIPPNEPGTEGLLVPPAELATAGLYEDGCDGDSVSDSGGSGSDCDGLVRRPRKRARPAAAPAGIAEAGAGGMVVTPALLQLVASDIAARGTEMTCQRPHSVSQEA